MHRIIKITYCPKCKSACMIFRGKRERPNDGKEVDVWKCSDCSFEREVKSR
jgi:DNA-directed RNA polymerase subunit M/transcription elongation factor TFIIS